MSDPIPDSLRPRDVALLFLATPDQSPRQRARDQQADGVGLELRRRVLNRLVVMDPDPEEIEAALATIISEFGEPSGPTRGVCLAILQDWNSATIGPGFVPWLLAEAIATGGDQSSRPKRRDGGHAP